MERRRDSSAGALRRRGTGEYGWLGSDDSGCVALFSTAGAGYAPKAFLCHTDAHDTAMQAVLAMPTTTEVKFAPKERYTGTREAEFGDSRGMLSCVPFTSIGSLVT